MRQRLKAIVGCIRPGLLILTILLAGQNSALCQAGSTGGSVGKQNKELSGSATPPEAESPAARSARPRAAGSDRSLRPGLITVTSATLGSNCGAQRGNVTSQVAAICNGHDVCELPGSRVNHPDPAYGCPKAFEAQWRCSGGGGARSAAVGGIALETNVLTLKCN
jgi:hypothetical protein